VDDLVIGALLIGFILAVVILYSVPLGIAQGRNVSAANIQTIKLLSFLGLFFGVTWIVALILACVYPSQAQTRAIPGMKYQPLGPGKFRITGIDSTTKMDTAWYCEVVSEANAKIKGELEGIIVTQIDRV
jgi:ABC-type antimicrobial peptide transport system permease subunit